MIWGLIKHEQNGQIFNTTRFVFDCGWLFIQRFIFRSARSTFAPWWASLRHAFTAPILGEAGKTFNSADMKGQVWLLNVWASWCGACKDEHPVLMEMAKTNKIATYGLDYKDTDADAQAVLAGSKAIHIKQRLQMLKEKLASIMVYMACQKPM